MSAGKVDLAEINSFNAGNLKHTDTKVKDATKGAYLQDQMLKGINEFTKDGNLKHTETVEKTNMPTKEDIEKEKEELKNLNQKSAF